MVRHKILKGRINKEAETLGEFTTRQMFDILNNYPNHDGYGVTHLQTSMNRLCNLLYANPKISVKEKYTCGDTRTIWMWKE